MLYDYDNYGYQQPISVDLTKSPKAARIAAAVEDVVIDDYYDPDANFEEAN